MRSFNIMSSKKITSTLLLLLACSSLWAQNSISPYSRFGIGQLESNRLAAQAGMGGIASALRNPESISIQNPASYSALKATTFDVGAGATIVRLTNNQRDQVNVTANIRYFTFAFPVTKKWGLAFGILPYSSVGYQITDQQITANGDAVKYIYSGEGGLSQFFLGNGFTLGKNLSVGVNAGYLFGNIANKRALEYTSTQNTLNTRISNSVSVGSVFANYGLQYTIKRGEDQKIIIGYSGALSTKLNATQSTIADRYFYQGTAQRVVDTIQNTESSNLKVTLPANHNIGITWQQARKWLVGVEGYYGNWAQYRSDVDKTKLENSYGVAIGTQFTPNDNAIGNYLKNIDYRLGVRAGKSFLMLNSTTINEREVSVGLGLPLAKVRSKVNIAVAYTNRGTVENNLLKEEILSFQLGLVLSDTWFVRRKYD